MIWSWIHLTFDDSRYVDIGRAAAHSSSITWFIVTALVDCDRMRDVCYELLIEIFIMLFVHGLELWITAVIETSSVLATCDVLVLGLIGIYVCSILRIVSLRRVFTIFELTNLREAPLHHLSFLDNL